MNVQYTSKARSRLLQIYEYYKDLGKGKYGRKIRTQITKKALLLRQFPKMGQEEEQLKELGLGHRFLVEGNYKIVYRIEGRIIWITDIFDTQQNPDNM